MAMSLFFGYTFVLTASFFLLTGTVGYFSCQWFINVIYSSIKASTFTTVCNIFVCTYL